jgi:TolB protein
MSGIRILALFVFLAALMALPNNPVPAGAAFPGDNGKIVFESDRFGDFEIFVMEPDGTVVTQLTSNAVNDVAPAWSADGTRIAWASSGNICVMDADGSNQTCLTGDPATEGDPAWSPDGTSILFERGIAADGMNEDIFVLDVATAAATPCVVDPARDMGPAWSPDGAYIAFHSNRDGDSDIYLATPASC